ncbi:dipeptide ABC transporter ATP-binding protein [Gulosibacter molinativorax]|uniref:ABC transporter ATP-binding protein n=1 Tax=Gulosibacter molinativorax TaxID=256821 RepID=A0ABT7C5E8_9MICO|nr:ABC transporter ATP-binding protein [Gulosibacter molinativorax]MDJ1370416.1 ABC transporter ATP-binding protein [Gulosibacter molinativorax]QUY61329.1 Putative peptide transport fused subunits of ABC ATP-binding components [Gulosibacter molinativorax]
MTTEAAESREARPVLLEVEDLHVDYVVRGQEVPAVRGVDLTMREGEIVAIVGESGSGKSTFAKAVLHLLADNGRVHATRMAFAGRDLTSLNRREWRKVRGAEIALIPQDPTLSLDPLMSVGKQVAETLRIHKLATKDEAQARAVKLLAEAGIPDPEQRAWQLPSEFSGGMRQRALIASALAGEPRLLVADEPTSALDVTVQRQILDHIERLRDELGIAVLLITHDLGVAADRADRILVMQHGQVVESGAAATVLANPEHDYTRRLVAAAPGLSGTTVTSRTPAPAQDAEVVLRVRDLRKEFKLRGSGETLVAVDNVAFDIRRGETFGLVGESGSGKSTTARVALQLERATKGTVEFDGVDITEYRGESLRQLRRRFQLVHQSPYASLDPRMTVGEIIREPLRSFKIGSRSEQKARVAELLDSVALPKDYAERRPDELSGGQRQRVSIARALATKPDCVVLDEAVSALDVSVQAQVLELLAQVQRDTGVAYLFISHDLGVVGEISHRIGVLQRGALVETGTSEAVLKNPEHPYTQALIAAIPGAQLSEARQATSNVDTQENHS